MTYQVLARKYRPQNFQEIVGQEHVVQALVNGLENNRLHHAFLFTGTRGVGKTTLARVLAKALNCKEGISGNPCGQCEHCTEIKQGDFIDLIEVDAASRTGVDDTRNLLENVQYAPNKGSYKIYLIDEVHMFSKSSFNALLKTLEEPPEHVKFLLATTEPDKLPVTVLSRCLQFNLKRLTQKQISDHLINLLQQENLSFDDQAIQLIARVADGSMRDALSLLDQSLAFGAGQVQYEEIRNMLGTIEQSHVIELMQLIADNNREGVIDKLEWVHSMSIDYQQLLEDCCALLHEVSLLQALGKSTGGSQFELAKLKSFAEQLSAESVQWYYQLVVLALSQIKTTPSKKVSFEMAVIRMLAFEPGGSATTVSPQPQNNQQNNQQTKAPKTANNNQQQASVPVGNNEVSRQSAAAGQQPSNTEAPVESAATIDLTVLTPDSWPTVFKQMRVKGMARELARNLELLENQEKVITFAVDETAKNFMTDKAKQNIDNELLSGAPDYKIKYVFKDAANTLARQAEKATQAKQSNVEQTDPVVADLQSQFGATIIQNE